MWIIENERIKYGGGEGQVARHGENYNPNEGDMRLSVMIVEITDNICECFLVENSYIYN